MIVPFLCISRYLNEKKMYSDAALFGSTNSSIKEDEEWTNLENLLGKGFVISFL